MVKILLSIHDKVKTKLNARTKGQQLQCFLLYNISDYNCGTPGVLPDDTADDWSISVVFT